jgi:hypothetical protein
VTTAKNKFSADYVSLVTDLYWNCGVRARFVYIGKVPILPHETMLLAVLNELICANYYALIVDACGECPARSARKGNNRQLPLTYRKNKKTFQRAGWRLSDVESTAGQLHERE